MNTTPHAPPEDRSAGDRSADESEAMDASGHEDRDGNGRRDCEANGSGAGVGR